MTDTPVTEKLATGVARQWTGSSRAEAYAFADWAGWSFDELLWWQYGGSVDNATNTELTQGQYWFQTPHGEAQMVAGDWAVKRTGLKYADIPYSPTTFADAWQTP